MSVRLIANVLDYVHGLPHGTKLLLLCLADYADDKGTCWPSFQSLANRSDMSRRHVIRVMSELETLGLVKRIEERPYKPTVYRLAVPTSDTHVTRSSDTDSTSDRHVTSDADDTRVVTPTSLGSDTHVTTTSDIAMSPKPPIRTTSEPPVEPPVGAGAPKSLPDNGPIQKIVKAWYERAGVEPANYAKALGFAKQLHAARVTPRELSDMYDWYAADPWRVERGFDLGTCVADIEKFRQSQRLPKPTTNGRASPQVTNAELSKAAIRKAANREPEFAGPVFETTGRISS